MVRRELPFVIMEGTVDRISSSALVLAAAILSVGIAVGTADVTYSDTACTLETRSLIARPNGSGRRHSQRYAYLHTDERVPRIARAKR